MTGIDYLLICISFLFILQAEFSAAFDKYQQRALEAHNTNRAKHGSPPLKLNDGLNQMAVDCAKYYIEDRLGELDHSCKNTSGYGENLYQSWPPFNSISHAVAASNDWYNEVKRFGWDNPMVCMYLKFMEICHFTAVVWQSTKELGIGYSEGKNKDGDDIVIVVGVYSPAGNDAFKVKENVLPPNISTKLVPQWSATLFTVGLFIMLL